MEGAGGTPTTGDGVTGVKAPTGGGRPGGNIGGRGSLRTGSVDEANGKGRKRVKPSCSAGGTTDAC